MLSPQSKYAIRAMIFIHKQEPEDLVSVEEIAKKTTLPSAYLSKIIKQLVESELLVSRRGKNGGVRINTDRKSISFFDVCFAVEDPIVKSECVLYNRLCDNEHPCAFHGKWKKTKVRLIDFLKTHSFHQIN